MTPRKIAAFALGPVAGALLGLITLPTITWFFAQEDVGRIAMLQITVGFSTLLFSLGLDQAYVREFHEVANKPALLKQSFLPGFLLLSVSLIALLSLGDSMARWLFDSSSWHLSLLIAIALLAAFVSRFLSLVLRMNERGLAFSMSQVLPKLLLLSFIGLYVFAEIDKTLTNLIVANAASLVFVSLVFAFNTRKEWVAGIASRIDTAHLRRMLKFGMPLILGGIAFWGLTAVDKVFLRTMANFEELAVYSVSVSFAAAAIILQNVFSTVWAPTVYKWASKGEGLENVQKVTRYVLALVVILFSAAGLLSWVVGLFLPAEYSEVQWIVVSCLGYPLFYTLSESTAVGIGISRRTGFSMLSAMIALIVNALGNWLLIPEFGAAGAAVSTCFSFWLFFLLRTEFSIFLWKPMRRPILYGYSALVLIGAIIFTLFGAQLGAMVAGFWLIVLMIAMQSFKEELKAALSFAYGVAKRRASRNRL